jgi:hypothetical protein
MKGKPIDHLVYECMFPKPRPGDPQNFHDFLRRQLVPEVRSETACFYGGLDSLEAQYPGLDYSYPPHRMRLGRYTWHRRLFRAFDTLRLTPSEIAGLTKWEGTRWARERYEKEHSIKIRDTTGDCIHDWVDPEQMFPTVQEEKIVEGDGDMEDMDDGDESDMEIDSVGVEVREAEEWLKDVADAGDIPSHIFPLPDNNVPDHISTTSMPPRLPNDTPVAQWHQILEFIEAHSQSGQTNLVTASGRTALSSISTTAPFNIQQQLQNPSLNGTNLSPDQSQPLPSTFLFLRSLQQRFQ